MKLLKTILILVIAISLTYAHGHSHDDDDPHHHHHHHGHSHEEEVNPGFKYSRQANEPKIKKQEESDTHHSHDHQHHHHHSHDHQTHDNKRKTTQLGKTENDTSLQHCCFLSLYKLSTTIYIFRYIRLVASLDWFNTPYQRSAFLHTLSCSTRQYGKHATETQNIIGLRVGWTTWRRFPSSYSSCYCTARSQFPFTFTLASSPRRRARRWT